MNTRQINIFKTIVKEYIEKAAPIGSKALLEITGMDISSATIRNEMAFLEGKGLIISPHTSAGRIPTETGLQYYLENFLQEKKISKKQKDLLDNCISKDFITNTKSLAKQISEISNLLVFIAYDIHDTYYTGLFNLFSQPEFKEQSVICNISKVIDHLDIVMADLNDSIEKDLEIFLGRNNPVGTDCGTIISRFNERSLLGMIGPMRMDYESNIPLIKYAKNLFEKNN